MRTTWARLTGVGRGVLERDFLSEAVGELSKQVADVSFVDVGVVKLVDDRQEEAEGADRPEGLGVVFAEEPSSGSEQQGCLNTEQGYLLPLEPRDDEAIVRSRAGWGMWQAGEKGQNRADVG